MAPLLPKKSQSQAVGKVIKVGLTQKYCIGGKRPQHRTGLSSKCSMDKWAFITKEEGGGQYVPKRKHRGKGDSGSTNLTKFLLTADQGEQISRVGDDELD